MNLRFAVLQLSIMSKIYKITVGSLHPAKRMILSPK